MMAEIVERARPVFIHAMWRTGSTYIWNKFRKMAGYRAYCEPLHEELARLRREDFEREEIRKANQHLHHPLLTRHYFDELPTDEDGWVPLYRKEFAHDLYCLDPEEEHPELAAYVRNLLDFAYRQGEIPVLQFNRSLFRSAWLSVRFSPVNILLLRDPYDTWKSFSLNEYFYGGVCRIIGQHRNHWYLRAIAERWKVPYVEGTYEEREAAYRAIYRERGDALYPMFYALICVSILQNLPHTDVVLDINALSVSDAVRSTVQDRLHSHQINISFDDCAIPQYPSDAADLAFRKEQEEQIRRYLRVAWRSRRSNLRPLFRRHAATLSPEMEKLLEDILQDGSE
jgi:hypothetical protein